MNNENPNFDLATSLNVTKFKVRFVSRENTGRPPRERILKFPCFSRHVRYDARTSESFSSMSLLTGQGGCGQDDAGVKISAEKAQVGPVGGVLSGEPAPNRPVSR